MIEDLLNNLWYCRKITIFFILWLVVATVAVRLLGHSKNGGRLSRWEALYYSMVTYAGVGNPESNPIRFKWAKLIHRLIGLLAWAYITAIFVTSII